MQPQNPNTTTWRIALSYLTSTISVSLVLFMLGLAGLMILNAGKLSNQVKESIGVSILFKDNTPESYILRMQKQMESSDYVRSTRYITKDEAAEELQKQLGEDFVDFLGYNPLLPSLDVHLKANYANADSMQSLQSRLQKDIHVHEVSYQESLVEVVNRNIRRITFIVMIFGGLLLIVSSALINNTFRMSIYARRFTIKTMQLVGASDNFIRKPFIMSSLVVGAIAAFFAWLLTHMTVYGIERSFSGAFSVSFVILLDMILLLIGTGLSALAALFAVNRYLYTSKDELYY